MTLKVVMITIRDEEGQKHPTKQELETLYWKNELNTPAIGEALGVSKKAVLKWMREYDIPRRRQGESLSSTLKKLWETPEYRATMMPHLREYWSRSEERSQNSKQLWKKPEFKEKMGQIQKALWKCPKHREKMRKAQIQGLHLKPTKPEQRLIQIVEKERLPFRYSGDGTFILDTLNPDFVSTNGSKKVIEIFGRTFHDPDETFKEEIPWHQQYWGRIARCAQLGYDCLILWDDELEDEQKLVEKIRRFS